MLGSHLPPAEACTEALFSTLSRVPEAEPFVGPNQAELVSMLAAMTDGAAGSGQGADVGRRLERGTAGGRTDAQQQARP